jgi:hypothetical protein
VKLYSFACTISAPTPSIARASQEASAPHLHQPLGGKLGVSASFSNVCLHRSASCFCRTVVLFCTTARRDIVTRVDDPVTASSPGSFTPRPPPWTRCLVNNCVLVNLTARALFGALCQTVKNIILSEKRIISS